MYKCLTKIKFGLTLCLSIYFFLFQALIFRQNVFVILDAYLKWPEVVEMSTGSLGVSPVRTIEELRRMFTIHVCCKYLSHGYVLY